MILNTADCLESLSPFEADLAGRFNASMSRLSPVWPEGRHVCAFSGGADSAALLSLLALFLPPARLLAAHLDHGLRPDSDAEAGAARLAAEKLGLRFESERTDVGSLARERGRGVEEAARWARYDFLYRVRDAWPGDFLVTAHQAGDQAETIILKLARGGGPGALAGIPAVNDGVLRPLLGFTRRELVRWLEARGVGWLEDPSNQDLKYARNKVRREVLPRLGELNPQILDALGRAARLASAEEEFWDGHLEKILRAISERVPDGWVRLSASGMYELTLAEQRRVAGRVLRSVVVPRVGGGEPVTLSSVDILLEMLSQPGRGGLDLPGGRRVEWRGVCLYVGPASRYNARSGA
jgi:tRNA(Ile)-lysidine synthase